MATDTFADAGASAGWTSRALARLRAVVFSAHGLAVVDQLVVSGASFGATILIGRAAGAAELGTYAIAVSIFATVIGIQNALILLPFSIRSTVLSKAHKRAPAPHWC